MDVEKFIADNKDTVFEGLVLDVMHGVLPIVSFQTTLIAKSDQIYNPKDGEMIQGKVYTGVVNGIVGSAGHVSVSFLSGTTKSIKVKDLDLIENYKEFHYPGRVIQVALNKLDRLCTKSKVLTSVSKGPKGKGLS